MDNFNRFDNQDVNVEAEQGISLNIDNLVGQANNKIENANDRLANLSPTFASRIKANIVNFWKNASNRFDTDAEDGLDQIEFNNYTTEMVAKVEDIIDQYAPSQEQVAEANKSGYNNC